MKKIKIFYGKLDWVGNEINDFLDDTHILVDLKQSLEQADSGDPQVLYTLIYTERNDARTKVRENLSKCS